MTLTVHPGQVAGTTRAPPSKSITHRALIGSLVAGGGTVAGPLWSEDTTATLEAVRAFGTQVIATDVEAVFRGAPLTPATIDAGNSGTTLRLATGVAALVDGTTTLTGDESLEARPMGPLADALEQLGATVTFQAADGQAPLEVTGPATGGHAKMPGDVSSQFVSALLMAAPLMPDGLTLELSTPLTSAPYVDLTIRTLDQLGVTVDREDDRFEVAPQDPQPTRLAVPGDYSAAAFGLVAGAIAGGLVTVTNLPEDTGQGDARITGILDAFGCPTTRDGDTVTAEGSQPTGARVDLGDTPDLFPPLAALAAVADGETVLEGAPHLKDKESDRIDAMVTGLTELGIEAEARDDGARIVGGTVEGGTVHSHGDHRIQMAFAVLALAAEAPVTIEGPLDAHAVSYPGFLDALGALGATVETPDTEPSKEATA